jgi:large subunit ribosomal protein L9
MKVILTQTVQGLGDAGTIKEVADGYARNYLLPKGLAVAATRGSIKQAEAQADIFARRAAKARQAVEASANALQDKSVVIRARVGSENRLYGSVTPADVSEALQSQLGISLDRRKIELGEAIHRVGTYQATADLGNGMTASFNVEVAPEVAGAHGKASRAASAAEAEPTAEAAPGAEAEAASLADVVGEPEAEVSPSEEAAEANPS